MTSPSKDLLALFDPISLDEMDSVMLLDRVDTKYSFHYSHLNYLLPQLTKHYRILEIDNVRNMQYESVYFDTPGMELYRLHHCGIQNRMKVRYRKYVESDTTYFEIKFKNNKGRTVKMRIRDRECNDSISEQANLFLKEHTPFERDILQPAVKINFLRSTLVNRKVAERVTIDTNLSFALNGTQNQLSHLVVAEVKQDRSSPSEFVQLMRQNHLRTGSLSKYCFAVATIYNDIRKNNFKMKIKKLNNLNYDSAAANCH